MKLFLYKYDTAPHGVVAPADRARGEKALLETRAAQAKEEAEKAARKSAKAKAKAEDAEREADPDGEGGKAE